MADPVLHIKDSYYFEVPKLLYPYAYTSRQQFPDVWISLDPEFQEWEAERLYKDVHARDAGLPPEKETLEDWHHWVHADHANFAKPLKEFLNEKYQAHVVKFNGAKAVAAKDKAPEDLDFDKYLSQLEAAHDADHDYVPFLRWRHTQGEKFQQAALAARNIQEWKTDKDVAEWSEVKIDGKPKLQAYNEQLSGKILLTPQPFGRLRNLYEAETTIIDQKTGWINYDNFGFCISKYMVIELFVGLVLVLLFSRFAARIERGRPAKGIFWNLIEVFLVFIRDQIAKPVLGSHDHEHAAADGHGDEAHGHGEHAHGAVARVKHDQSIDPAVKFLPLLWTIFFFVLGCNLMGILPWAGAPTAAFAVTFAMACVTFFTVVVAGMLQFGVLGFFLNQIPGMDLPWYMAIFIKPMVLAIELLGLLIKHGVLAVRLLANMVAGHLVILGIMGLAFGADAALQFSGEPGWKWGVTAAIAIIASAAFSVLELFVAFLQAYIITFLSALFIGAAIHKH
jgi:F-type H+-transporting ATPase subunit a